MNQVEIEKLSKLFDISAKMIKTIVNADVKNQYEKIVASFMFAANYFGTIENTVSWFLTENIGLGDVTPISLLNTDSGLNRVQNCINKLNFGMTA